MAGPAGLAMPQESAVVPARCSSAARIAHCLQQRGAWRRNHLCRCVVTAGPGRRVGPPLFSGCSVSPLPSSPPPTHIFHGREPSCQLRRWPRPLGQLHTCFQEPTPAGARAPVGWARPAPIRNPRLPPPQTGAFGLHPEALPSYTLPHGSIWRRFCGQGCSAWLTPDCFGPPGSHGRLLLFYTPTYCFCTLHAGM
jgi:hypothetical protein